MVSIAAFSTTKRSPATFDLPARTGLNAQTLRDRLREHITPFSAVTPVLNRTGFAGGFNSCVGWSIMGKRTNKFSSEVRERAVQLVFDNQGQHGACWHTVRSISSKIGCAPQTLSDWVNKAGVDSGKRADVSSEMAEEMTAPERENRELRQANEILRKVSAYFATA